jgi:hypothetical protein
VEYPKAKQIRLYRKYAELAFDRALQEFADDREAIIQEGLDRLKGQGFDVYQDQSWHKSPGALRLERRAENADDVVYMAIELALEAGE